jgi:hypothetical protein
MSVFEWFKDDWLVSRRAVKLFSISTVFVLATVPIFFVPIDPEKLSPLFRIPFGIEGLLGPLSIFFLWIGMWRYWLRLDSSTGFLKATSFFLLLLGLAFGAVLYCFIVYRPQVLRRSWGQPPDDDGGEYEKTPLWGNRKIAVTMACAILGFGVLLPEVIKKIGWKDHLDDYWAIVTLLFALALICALAYPLVQLFRIGMRTRR